MSLSSACRHNQSLVISAVICTLCFGGIAACHLTQAQKKDIITTTAIVAEAVAEQSPIPWSQIGLAIGSILGAGSIVDNRRKDTLIKRLKTENAEHLNILRKLVIPNRLNHTGVPPINNN